MPCDSHEAADATAIETQAHNAEREWASNQQVQQLWVELSRECVSGAGINQVHRDPSQVSRRVV